jgi:beta-barrel assembly-enhancing protease
MSRSRRTAARWMTPVLTVIAAALVFAAPPATPAGRPPQAAPADRRAAPDGAPDRARTIERMLRPASAAEMQAAATLSKDAKSRSDAAEAYDRALVFYEQGAFAEAEKEFRNAEKKDGDNVETVLAMGWVYDKVHKPDDAIKRFEKIYKKDPRNTRALAGMAASYEEMQKYREAVRLWQRYVRTGITAPEQREGQALLAWAQDMFVKWYEIAENPGGGAANALTTQQELQLGQQAAQEFATSGVEPLKDEAVTTYVANLCAYLVANAKNFPSNYQVFVIDTADVNAFTIPGFIFVNRGLLGAVDSEAELAGVIAHEIGHVVAHHSAKKLTKQATDEQQAEQWRNSNSKFLRWLGSSSGSGYGQAAFSREAEEQADRLAVHIAYDAGLDPRGFAWFFQKLESIAPSSRKSWDLMARTHPFSIDRLNTINAYIDLLPARPLRTTSPEFTRMRARLSTLPPPTDATGMQRPALEAPRAEPPSRPGPPAGAAAGATQPFTMDTVPFAGEIPAGWNGRKSPAGTFIFEGPKGTEAYEVSIELGLEPKRSGLTIDHVARAVVDALSGKARAEVQTPARETADDGTPVRIIKATYGLQGQGGTLVPIRHLTVVMDYPGYYGILSYFTPDSIYQKYSEAFTLFLQKFRHTGR